MLIPGLSEGQIAELQRATERLLEDVGLRVQHAGLLRKAKQTGAVVDEATGSVRIPAALLRELLAQAPASYDIAGVAGGTWTIGGDAQHCSAIVTDPWIVDYESQRPRRPRLEDLRRHTIIAQCLDQVAAVSRMDFPVTDVEGPTSSLRALEEHLLRYGKHVMAYTTGPESLQQWLEIGEILFPERGSVRGAPMSVAVAVISPLVVAEFNAEVLLSACANGFAVIPTVCPMAGTTAPYSTAATLLQGNAEEVGLAALVQMVKPGTPFLYHFGPSVTDMRDGHDLYYTMEKVLWKLAAVQLARAYRLPAGAECGGTMTYRYDQQNGAEGMLFMLAAQRSGANVLAGIGSCYNAIGMSAEMMLIQIAWLEIAKFLGAGIDTSDLQAGLDSISRAGPGGHFLSDEFTLKRLRSGEFFSNDLLDVSGKEDGTPLLQRAHERAQAMVEGFTSPVPESTREALRRYFREQYRKLG